MNSVLTLTFHCHCRDCRLTGRDDGTGDRRVTPSQSRIYQQLTAIVAPGVEQHPMAIRLQLARSHFDHVTLMTARGASLLTVLAMPYESRNEAASEQWTELNSRRDGQLLYGQAGNAYDERAFRYFLSLERRRGERSGRSLLLLLVRLKGQPGAVTRITPPMAGRLFGGLWHCVREVDFIGWFREERIAGAVLTQGEQSPGPDVRRLIAGRVTDLLSERLTLDATQRLQVRVVQLAPSRKS
jgi:hypothetical protein